MEPKCDQIYVKLNQNRSKTKPKKFKMKRDFLRFLRTFELFIGSEKMRALAPSSEKMRALARIVASSIYIHTYIESGGHGQPGQPEWGLGQPGW